MTHTLHRAPDQTTAEQARNALRITVIGAIGLGIIFIADLLNVTAGNYLTLIPDGILFITMIVAAWLSRHGRVKVGMLLLLGVVDATVLVLVWFLSGFGWLGAVAIVVLSTIVATTVLPDRWSKWILGSNYSLAALVIALETFWPAGQATTSDQTLTRILTVGLCLVYTSFAFRQFANYSLRTKLIIGFIGIGVVSVGIVSFFTTQAMTTTLTDTANQNLLSSANRTAATLDEFVRENLDEIRTEAQLPIMADYLAMASEARPGSPIEVELLQTLYTLSSKDPIFITSYGLMDRFGQDLLDTDVREQRSYKAIRDYFVKPKETGLPYVSYVEFSQVSDEVGLNFSSPVRNPAGQIVGVLRMRYNAAILQKLIFENNNLAGPQSFAILFDDNHVRLAHGLDSTRAYRSVVPLDPTLIAQFQATGRLPNRPLTELSTDLVDLEQGLQNIDTQPFFNASLVSLGGRLGSAAVVRMSTQPWLVSFFQPQDIFLAPVRTQTNTILLITISLIVGVGFAAVWIGQSLAQPIIRLTEVAQRVTGGDLSAQAVVEAHDETGQLATAFNTMTTQLREFIGSLEGQVRERTAELALSMDVGQRAAAIRSLDELLPTITEYIRAQFNLYYTQVYFIDDLGQNLILRVGTGAVGEQLLARRHQLPLGPGSIVGRVAAEGKSIVVSDTQNSAIHKANPLLPATRAEMAVPLLVEGRVIGVLDMQADKVNTFTESNLTVFEAMATQLAIAIDGAQQWAQAREAQQKTEEAVRQLTRQSWVERLASPRESFTFAYDLAEVVPLLITNVATANGGKKLTAPVVVQNEPIGELTVTSPAQRALSADAQILVTAVAQQLAQKAENLRLFEQTQQRAAREQMARQITDKIRASRDIESALKTAAEELSKALGATRAVVDLKVSQADQNDS